MPPALARPSLRLRAAPAAAAARHAPHRLVAPTPPPASLATRLGTAPVAVQVAVGGILAWAVVRAARAVAGRGCGWRDGGGWGARGGAGCWAPAPRATTHASPSRGGDGAGANPSRAPPPLSSLSSLESRGYVGDADDRSAPRLSSDAAYQREQGMVGGWEGDRGRSGTHLGRARGRARIFRAHPPLSHPLPPPGAMRGVNVVAYEELDAGVVAAARARRAREATADAGAFAGDVPDDHPFAVRQEV